MRSTESKKSVDNPRNCVDNYEQWLKKLEKLSIQNGLLEYFQQTTPILRSIFDENITPEKLVEYWRKL